MSGTANAHEVHSVEKFYERWGSDLFAFCRLFLGDILQAESTCGTAFLAFYRSSARLEVEGEIPAPLVRLAVQQMNGRRAQVNFMRDPDVLESCILSLRCEPRAVFIMRNVLGMSWTGVATAMGVPIDEVHELWTEGMMRVRELLPRDFCGR